MNVQALLTRSQQVYIGDADGDVYTPNYLLPFYATALDETYKVLGVIEAPAVQRTAFAKIEAKTRTSLRGGVDWLPEFQRLISVDSRPLLSAVGISAMTVPTFGFIDVTTAAAHGRAAGDVVEIGGGTGLNGALGQFVVSAVADATHLTVQGYTWTGIYGGGAQLLYSSHFFQPMVIGSSPGGLGAVWMVEGNVLQFEPSPRDREFRVIYGTSTNPTPALGDEVVLPEAVDYLAARSAMIATGANGAQAKYQELKESCWGEGGTLQNPGGKLGLLLDLSIKIQQLQPGLRPLHWSRVLTQAAESNAWAWR